MNYRRDKTFRLLITIILVFNMLFIFTSCDDKEEVIESSQKEETIIETEIETEEETEKVTLVIETIEDISNGTLLADDIKVVDDFIIPGHGIRPYAVMVDNQGKRVLPQGGLDQAQIVYEIVVESGITRFMPIFWDAGSTMIGPVRSARHYFLDYAFEYDSIYVNYGWSYLAANDLILKKLTYINGMTNGEKMFWDITKNKNNWQDTYTNTEKIYENIERLKYRKTTKFEFQFKYYKDLYEQPNSQDANSIKIKYSKLYNCGYEYDIENKKYLRIRDGMAHIERISKTQISPVNIIVMKVENHTINGDEYDRQDLKTTGSGAGYYFSLGKVVNIRWEKDERFTKTRYYLENGDKLNLNIGQTWIQIVPIETSIEIK